MFAISQVALNLSARELKLLKIANSKYSMRCTLLMKNGSNAEFVEIDKTEMSDDCFNPDWSKKFMIAFKFYETQALRFDVYRCLKLGNEQQKVGESKLSFAELVTAKDGFTMKAIKSGESKVGKLLINIKEAEIFKEALVLQFSGKNLDKKDLFGLSDPYFIISKIIGNSTTEVYKSEILKSTLTPVWSPFKIRVKTLCDSDRQMKLQFSCYDWDRKTEDELIGTFSTTLEKLLSGKSDENNLSLYEYQLIHPNKLVENFKSYKNSGIVCLDSIQVTEEKSFVDYLRTGVRFYLKIALDFSTLLSFYDSMNSAQNNEQKSNKANILKLIMKGIDEIIEQYNHQRLLTASGFGAVFAESEASDYYEMNKSNKFYDNIEAIIQEYENLLKSVKPLPKQKSLKNANFEPTITHTLEWIEQITKESMDSLDYFIIFLMTSEVNVDMLKTLEEVMDKTFTKPISIVIIDNESNASNGQIGDTMNGLVSKKKANSRNNIQYISTQSYSNSNSLSDDWHKLVDKLVRDVLSRIPDQYIEYFGNKLSADKLNVSK